MHLEGILEASERHLGGMYEAFGRHLEGILEASEKHLGRIWEVSGDKSHELRFHVHGSAVTLTKSAACAQKFTCQQTGFLRHHPRPLINTIRTPLSYELFEE